MLGDPELRRRHVERGEEEENTTVVSGVTKTIRNLDIFRKTNAVAVEGTSRGAALTGLVIAVMLVLLVIEFRTFIRDIRVDTMGVDVRPDDPLNIYFNISFPSVACNGLHIDVVDVAGSAQIDVAVGVTKQPITKRGDIIPVGPAQIRNRYAIGKYDPRNDPASPEYCGACFVRAYNHGTCCNTCHQVLEQLRKIGVSKLPSKNEIPQCVNEISSIYPGCNMYGVLTVGKVTGNFHFAPGHSFSHDSGTRVHHIHEFDPSQVFDASHLIHELRFGSAAPGILEHSLDQSSTITNGTSVHKYFLQVVPTTVKSGIFSRADHGFYQYSFTRHSHAYEVDEPVRLTGVFFVYDFSPIRVTYHITRMPLTHFLVKVCALIGGVFAVVSFLDRVAHESYQALISKKYD